MTFKLSSPLTASHAPCTVLICSHLLPILYHQLRQHHQHTQRNQHHQHHQHCQCINIINIIGVIKTFSTQSLFALICSQPSPQLPIRAGPQSQKWSDQQITLNPTGSIHKKAREKKFDPKKVDFD